MADGRKWDAATICAGLVRLDTYEESLGDEWRGSVLLDPAQARRLAVDLSRAAADAEAGTTKERKR